MNSIRSIVPLVFGLLLAGAPAGCSKKDGTEAAQAGSTKEAASFIEKAFANAPPEVKATVEKTCAALRKPEYVEAVVGLQALNALGNLTVDQGMAMHGATANLEAAIAIAMGSGDPKAKEAFQLIKALKRR
jgi:hypothetical protein